MSKKLFYYGSTASFSNPLSVETDGTNEFIRFGTSVLNASQGSISMWVKVLTAPLGFERLLSSEASGYYALDHYGLGSNNWRFYVNAGTIRYSPQITLTPNIWYHVVCSYKNGGDVKIYRNAVASTGNTVSTNIDVASANFLVGGVNLAGYQANARFNLFETWNIQLSDAQVTELYNGGVPIDPGTVSFAANLTHEYRNGNGDTYPTITDRTGAKNGTMTNMEAGDFVSDAP